MPAALPFPDTTDWPAADRRLPRHLSQDEVRRFFEAITSAREQALFSLICLYDLRVGEVPLLQVGDDVPVRLLSFTAGRGNSSVVIEWEISDAVDHAGFHFYREMSGGNRERVSGQLLSGRTRYRVEDTLASAGALNYWLSEVSRSGSIRWYGPRAVAAAAPKLSLSCQSNPFSGVCRVSATLSAPGRLGVSVFDARGSLIVNLMSGHQGIGLVNVSWDARDKRGRPVPAGVYFVRLSTPAGVVSERMVYRR